jgi:hypothetical protein
LPVEVTWLLAAPVARQAVRISQAFTEPILQALTPTSSSLMAGLLLARAGRAQEHAGGLVSPQLPIDLG